MEQRVTARGSRTSTSMLVLIALLIGSLLLGTAPAQAALPAQPQLLELAAAQPQTSVQVIVQKLVQDSSLESRVAQLGGTVTKNLRIINAFAAELPAKAVPELAQAPGVRWISLDAATVSTACSKCIDTTNLKNAYVRAIGADKLWNASPYLQGQGIGVAVVDSGVAEHDDLKGRIVASVDLRSKPILPEDWYGHGTHVAGIIGGNGTKSNGNRIGVAPRVNLISVQISDHQGAASTSDVVAGLQWVYNNRTKYNIRVVNLSLNSSVSESYHTSPLNAAVEILWFNKIVVVVSAGNNGSATLYPPANDPFVITVGATDDKGTTAIKDDVIASFSAYGTTKDGIAKPDLVAPGTNIISPLSDIATTVFSQHPKHRVGAPGDATYFSYFRMSGTSMAAPVVSGAVALLLQDEPNLTPDQVKYRLKATAIKDTALWPGYTAKKAGAGYLDIYAAVNGTTTESANTGMAASRLLWTGSQPLNWSSANWNSANWNSANWNSANWNSANWNSANWNSTYWDD